MENLFLVLIKCAMSGRHNLHETTGRGCAQKCAQLGHASIQTTLDRYGHLLPETHQHVGEHLDTQLFEVEQSPNPIAR